MLTPRAFALAAIAVLPVPLPLAAAAQFENPRRPLLAVTQTLALNVVLNRVNDWIFKEEWARTSTGSISRNLRLGWDWDEDSFQTNMLAHPYNGAWYFNAGRANGLDFWESVPLAFLGSWTWEYFGETERPSVNDFLMTSFGGIAVGEMFHRIAASIRDNRARGFNRLWRELVGVSLDPVTAVNRLGRGQWSAVGANPPEYAPGGIVLRLHLGARYSPDTMPELGAAGIDVVYRDPLLHPYQRPFDVFGIRLTFGAGLDLLRASGRLYGKEWTKPLARLRNAFAVNHRFDFVGNPSQRFGGQSMELGLYSELKFGRDWAVRTHAFGDVTILGAIDAPGDGLGKRNYDFGSGGGIRLQAGIERRNTGHLTLRWQSDYLHGLSGASADHVVRLAGIEVTASITSALGVGFHMTSFGRDSRYSDRAPDSRDHTELRIVATWTRDGFGPHEAP